MKQYIQYYQENFRDRRRVIPISDSLRGHITVDPKHSLESIYAYALRRCPPYAVAIRLYAGTPFGDNHPLQPLKYIEHL